jgi:hypothetical protein
MHRGLATGAEDIAMYIRCATSSGLAWRICRAIPGRRGRWGVIGIATPEVSSNLRKKVRGGGGNYRSAESVC